MIIKKIKTLGTIPQDDTWQRCTESVFHIEHPIEFTKRLLPSMTKNTTFTIHHLTNPIPDTHYRLSRKTHFLVSYVIFLLLNFH